MLQTSVLSNLVDEERFLQLSTLRGRLLRVQAKFNATKIYEPIIKDLLENLIQLVTDRMKELEDE